MPQRTRHNHFVAQSLLQPWSEDGNRVWAYRILVSNDAVPQWTIRSIRGSAFQQHLYTELSDGEEVDDFERWLETEYETPAQVAIARVLRDDALTPGDWERLALLLAAQDVRTPTNFLETMQLWDKEMPELLSTTLKESVQRLERASADSSSVPLAPPETGFFKGVFQIKVIPPEGPDADEGKIHAEVVLGRRFWLESQRHLLTNTSKVLRNHKWSIAEPAAGNTWFTSDHPVVRLNYYDIGKYDLKGGWGNPGSELMMPLSPRHLLFTQVGREAADRLTFAPEQTREIQRILAERAHRWIFAREPTARVAWFRPRHVDAAAFKAEEEEWRNWHRKQNAADQPSLQDE